GARKEFWLLVAHPEGLEDRMRRVEVGADVVIKLGRAEPLLERRRLRLGPTVHLDHRRPERAALRIADNHAVQLRAERQGFDRRWTVGDLLEQTPDARMHRPGPERGILLRPSGVRGRDVIGLM